MSMEMEVYHIDVEPVLHDVIHVIFKYLSEADLLNVAKVCKSWRCAALREKNRRHYIQQIYLPYKNSDLVNMLDAIPSATLLIYDSRLEKSLSLPASNLMHWPPISNGLEEEVLNNFKIQPPTKTVVLMVEKYISTAEKEFNDDEQQREEQSEEKESEEKCEKKGNDERKCNCNVLGIVLLSLKRRVRVHITSTAYVWWPQRNPNRGELVDRLAEELGLNDCEYPKSTVIQLALRWGKDYMIIGELGKRFREKGKEIVWISIFGRKLVVNNLHSESRGNAWQSSVLMRISGPGIESWSTYIHFTARRSEIKRKLNKLKDRVKLKTYHTGLLYAFNCYNPACSHNQHPCGNSHELMYSVKRVFPKIQFTGFFSSGSRRYNRVMNNPNTRGNFSDVFDEDNPFKEDFLTKLSSEYVSIIIITYD